VLASVTNQELTSYAWIFPNVVTNGHWWYSNTPAFIEHDLAARLEAVPRTKQIGYYSDMYKLEFALPKFAMFKRILAKVLAERFVIDRGWSESQAIALGTQVLRGNVETIFRWGENLRGELPDERSLEPPLSTTPHFGPFSSAAVAEAQLAPTILPGEADDPREHLGPAQESVVIPVPQDAAGESELRLAVGTLAPNTGSSRDSLPMGELVNDVPVEADLEVIPDDDEGVRKTWPVPAPPGPEQNTSAPGARYEDQWGFLTRDDRQS
jgi:hypothetical protein